MSARERHKFRISVKKIRYAAEFFESLFPGKREQTQLARLSGHLKKLQDALGSLNDFIAHQKMAADAVEAQSLLLVMAFRQRLDDVFMARAGTEAVLRLWRIAIFRTGFPPGLN
jgi:CHAD domain-containing protein